MAEATGASLKKRRREAATGRGSTPRLSKEQILRAALELISRNGLDAFSVRELAKFLSVYPAAIYWHVPGGKNALLAEVAAIVFLDMKETFSRSDTWDQWLRKLFYSYRESLRRHPNVAPLLGAQLVSNAGIQHEIIENLIVALREAGFHGEELVNSYNAVVAALLGYVTLELAPAPTEAASEWAAEYSERIMDIDSRHYPNVADNIGLFANRAFILRWESGNDVPLDGGFYFYVDCFIEGLKAISRRSSDGEGDSLTIANNSGKSEISLNTERASD